MTLSPWMLESLENITFTYIEDIPFSPQWDCVWGRGKSKCLWCKYFWCSHLFLPSMLCYVFKVQTHAKNTLLLLPPLSMAIDISKRFVWIHCWIHLEPLSKRQCRKEWQLFCRETMSDSMYPKDQKLYSIKDYVGFENHSILLHSRTYGTKA